MDYEKKYNEAIEKAKEIIKYYKERNRDEASIEDLEIIFPELKESDDDNIRGAIIDHLKDNNLIEWAAWLEKQGEHNSTWSEEDDNNMIMVEDRLSDYLDYIRGDNSLTKHRKNSIKEEVIGYVNWLKSLKERVGNFDDGYKVGFSAAKHNQWKPSDEQMAALSDINVTGCISYAGQGQELINLYNELKKLKENKL